MQLFPLILFGIATAFSPGPNNIMTSYTAFNFGFRKAIPTMLGVIIGWTLLIILLQLTSGAIFQKYAFIQTTIKILGSIYLLYMAYKLSFAVQTKDKKIEEAKPLMKKISDNYKKLLDYFPENTKEGFKTGALPSIWENKDEFNALMQKASDDMLKLAKAIDTAEDLRAVQKELMWSNCSACHSKFRAPH